MNVQSDILEKKASLLTRLNGLLEETTESVQCREKAAFDQLLKGTREVVIFGAGNLGKKALRSLREQGYVIRGFLDNNSALHGSEIDGVPVYSITKGWLQLGDSVGVVVAIYFGEAKDTMEERIAPLRKAGFTKIAHLGHLAWKHPEGLLPHYSLDLPSHLLSQEKKIIEAFHLFDDPTSQRIFVDHVEWRLTLNFDLLPKPVADTIYFHEHLLRPNAGEFLIDGGAFTGDTLKCFVEGFGKDGFYKVLCFEPDPKNFLILQEAAAALSGQRGVIEVYQCALGDAISEITVESSGESSSRVGHGEIKIPCRMIDEFHDGEHWPTFIKLDIEGYELPALRGAIKTIQKQLPVLAISAYHRQNDLWELPLMIHAMQPEYSFRLVPHVADGWDLVLYAATKARFLH